MMRIVPLVAASLVSAALVYGCSSSSGAGGRDGGSDGSTLDVRAEAHPPPADDFDSGDASTSTCPTPADIASWTPPALVPPKTSPGACSASEFAGYDAACLNAISASTGACDAFQLSNVACVDCINSSSTDAAWGPLVSWAGVSEINTGGCLQLMAPSDSACAFAEQNAQACRHIACDAVCPVTQSNTGSFTLWEECATAADADACASFVARSMCLATDDAAAGTICDANSSATFEGLFLQIAPLFCGGGDGGGGDGGSGEATAGEGGTDSAPADATGE
jgi:hypothetical protein